MDRLPTNIIRVTSHIQHTTGCIAYTKCDIAQSISTMHTVWLLLSCCDHTSNINWIPLIYFPLSLRDACLTLGCDCPGVGHGGIGSVPNNSTQYSTNRVQDLGCTAQHIDRLQRCQHSIFKMLNNSETQPQKCLIYDEMVKNFPIFCLISTIFFVYIK